MSSAVRTFKPANDKQKTFLESTHDEILYSGTVGAGKSRLGCEKGKFLNMRYPGNQGLIIRKEFSAVKSTTIKTLLEEVIPHDWLVSHKKTEHEIIHRTGQFDKNGKEIYSKIYYFGLDKRADQEYPTKILSSQFGWIFVDEGIELTQEEWDVLSTRLRFKIPHFTKEENDKMLRQMFSATNPDNEYHWMHGHFINLDPKKFDNQEQYEEATANRLVVYTTAYDNHHLPANYITKLEYKLTGITRRRLLLGEWVGSEGMIYSTFNPVTQVIGDEIKEEDGGFLHLHDYKEFVIGADSNYPKPRAAVLCGIRGNGRIDVLYEFYEEHAQVEDFFKRIKDFWLALPTGRVPFYGYHDPSDPEAIKKLRFDKFAMRKAKNAVCPGISEVEALFTNDKIRIHERCHNLIKELQSYSWDKNTVDDKPDKKKPDHACDALRYAVFSHGQQAVYKPVYA